MAKTGRRVQEELTKKAAARKGGHSIKRPVRDNDDDGASSKIKLRKK